MKLDVVFTPQGLLPADVAGRTVFVIDILRATTAMCAALANGAKAVIPVASSEEAVRLGQTIGSDDLLLAGERNCVRIPGFQLGNSPLEMTGDTVRGRTIIMATTNGTKAMLATQGASTVYAAAAVNLTLAGATAHAALKEHHDILIVCAGRDGALPWMTRTPPAGLRWRPWADASPGRASTMRRWRHSIWCGVTATRGTVRWPTAGEDASSSGSASGRMSRTPRGWMPTRCFPVCTSG